ncbi:MAG TPA: hypothetical protein EYP53_05380 [Candidatus Latescibacteria bacterium]|nr:hypothetical protein [Candidatus Latescibacterota bacterium]
MMELVSHLDEGVTMNPGNALGGKRPDAWPFEFDSRIGVPSSFSSCGFKRPVVGIVYEGGTVEGGVPLGGLGTGYLELRSDGKLGRCSIFNDFCPPLTLNIPFLAVSAGEEVRLLCLGPPEGLRGAEGILYWGHFPVADLEYCLDLPIRIGLRAFTPFIPGDAQISNTPVALFELELANIGAWELSGWVALSFPGPKCEPGESFGHEAISDPWPGVVVRQKLSAGYALVVLGPGEVLKGGYLGNPGAWKGMARGEIPANGPGATVAVRYALKQGESRRIRFILSWYYPHFHDSSGEPHTHAYKLRFDGPEDVVKLVADGWEELQSRTLAWQEAIFAEDLPGWLKNALINGLYSMAKNTLWVVSERPDNWYLPEGFFTHNESFTGCPITETMVCRMHGHFPTLFFFPELERTTLHAFRHFQLRDGEVPFCFGRPTGMRDPRYHCQHPLNSAQYVQMIYRYYLRTGDRAFLEEYYPSVKDAIHYLRSLDYDSDGLVNDHSHALPGELWPANQFYDIWPWFGTSAYVAGTWLATLRCTIAIARELRDEAYAEELEACLERGLNSYDEKLWNSRYYRLYNDPEKGRTSETCLGNQLMAEWCTGIVGVKGVLPPDKVQKTLESIERLNFPATRYGLVNGIRPDGTPDTCGSGTENDHARQIFVGESLCAAMTFILRGRREVGLEIGRRLMEAIYEAHRTPWNQRCLIASDDGRPIWGDDYYSNMVIWTLPMVLAGQDIRDFCAEGGLVGKILAKGRAVKLSA